MMFSFNIKSSMLFFFVLHGLIFSTLLFIKAIRNDNKADKWLGFFVLLCTLYICPFMLGYAGWYSGGVYREIMFYMPFQQLLLLSPVLYFYVRSLLDKDFKLSKKHLIHFLPAIVYGAYSIIVLVTDKVILNKHYFYADGRDKDFDAWYQVAGFISLLIYLILCLGVYKRYKVNSYEHLSFADSVLFRWAQLFLTGLLILLLLRGAFFITNPEWDQFGRKFWYYLSFSILFYYLSVNGYVNSIRTFVSFQNSLSLNTGAGVSAISTDGHQGEDLLETSLSLPGGIESPDKKPLMDNLGLWKEKIEKLMMEDRLYANSTLTISDLSALLHVHSKKVSQIIHQGYGMNFNDFVNTYRTNELIKKMEAGEHNLQTLLGMAYDCGFNSKSTFNRSFKRLTGTTPKEYLQKIVSKEVPNPDLPPSFRKA